AQRCSGLESGVPLVTALLNYRHSQGQSQEPAELPPALQGIEQIAAQERTNYPFTLSVDDLGDAGLALSAQVSTPAQAPRVCALMQQALQGLVLALQSAPD
ncbi:hypothetical protein H5407_23945, partial [Mitsuaria sp. WAJ17]|uniref:hypothetical protein n=1 Tax=Mitsuaria sp. WAJ17 TaxID=2761452 RepID=UPI001600DBAA